MEFKEALAKIAEINNTTEEAVLEEMQQAINIAYSMKSIKNLPVLVELNIIANKNEFGIINLTVLHLLFFFDFSSKFFLYTKYDVTNNNTTIKIYVKTFIRLYSKSIFINF